MFFWQRTSLCVHVAAGGPTCDGGGSAVVVLTVNMQIRRFKRLQTSLGSNSVISRCQMKCVCVCVKLVHPGSSLTEWVLDFIGYAFEASPRRPNPAGTGGGSVTRARRQVV